MTNKKKLYIFSASALLVAVLMLLLFVLLKDNKKPDKNGMFKIDNMWFEMQKEITEGNAQKFVNKINTLRDDFLSVENKVFYSIVPDKSYYIDLEGYSVPDYGTAISFITQKVNGEYIDLTTELSLQDYYSTDPHWRQEKLQGVVNKLGDKMGFTVDLSSFSKAVHKDFVGSYSKHLQGKLATEDLNWLENDATENVDCRVFTRSDFEEMPVYPTDKLSGKMPYDVFLNGASPLITLTNANSSTDKELIIFRDSYGSSLAPLLIDNYRKITLIDLRYMASVILPEYVTFTHQDVLFIYSTAIIADSGLLR